MSSSQSIGLSGLLTSQRLIDLAGQNIANAGTKGYHRQVGTLAPRTYGGEIGLGVEILQVRRVIDAAIENAITRNTYALSDVTTQLTTLRQLETEFMAGAGSPHELLERFFNEAEQLAGRPDDLVQRRMVLSTAVSLTERLNSQYTELQRIQRDLEQTLRKTTAQVNQLAERIANYNEAIQRNTIQDVNANDLADQRDILIGQLSELIDVRVVEQKHGVVNVVTAGLPIVIGTDHLAIETGIDANNQAFIRAVAGTAPLAVTGGKLHGLLTLRNRVLPDVLQRLTTFTRTLVQGLDTVHATGLGLSGSFSQLTGLRGVSSVNTPLAQAGLEFPPSAGSLFVTVTDLSSGERTLHEIAIDPATQSLNDVAAALSAVPNVQGLVDPQTGTLTVVAAPGFAFDFAGRLPTAPQAVAITGAATPRIGGAYTGTLNDAFTYTVVGSGTVGVTPNLMLEARNSAGQLLGSWNIGQGYEPGASLPALNGVHVGLDPGTLNNGDSFSTRVVGNADSANLLGALGMNTFFEGGIGTLKVRGDLIHDPARMSASRSGLPADGANLLRLTDLRDQNLLGGGTVTLREYYANLSAQIGADVQDLDQRQLAAESLGRNLETERQSISGVNPDEELLRLVQFQRAYQMSARFLAVVDETLDELLRLV
jgi:flagellar hook-associated protein 1